MLFIFTQTGMNAILIMAAAISQMVGVLTLLGATTVNVKRDTICKRIVNSSVKVSSIIQ